MLLSILYDTWCMTLVTQLECSVECILITKEQQFNNLQFKNVLRVYVSCHKQW